VLTEVEGKATGWKAFYQNGKWLVEKPKKKADKKVAKKTAAKKKVAKKKKSD
jgi:DNA topoisomerase-1